MVFRILLQKPPAGVDIGLQSGSGHTYRTIQTQRSTGQDLTFEFAATLKPAKPGEPPDFAGPFVQGKRGERFVYLDIGTAAGQIGSLWTRRLKIPFSGLPPQDSLADDAIVETEVPGTGKDGGPTCGTVKPFSGWRPIARRPGSTA